ncbi:MAG: UbiD family decarboxylase [Rhodospirillales bacterium]|nr:UbiD family decarboxylase [Rhodospirillales bacterium]
MQNDLRNFLNNCDSDLLKVKQRVNPRFEIAALLSETQLSGEVVLFENIEGYPGARVVGNILSCRKRMARALGTTEENLAQTYLNAKENAVEPIMCEGKAPVKEVVHKAPQDILSILPILTHYENDAAPYITSGVVFAKDPKTERRAMGIHRMMFHGGNQLGIFLANPPLSLYLAEAEASGEPLEVAIALGVDPATLLASVVKVGPVGPDKVEIAGGLRGAPVQLTPGETINLEIPAYAEVVIEGKVLPNVRKEEGPFGENTGYYFSGNSPVLEVTAICHRKDFIYSSLCPWTTDVDNLLSLAAGTELLGQLQTQTHGVCDLELVTGTCGFTANISVKDLTAPDVRRIILLALGIDRRLKSVTVVDDDVDIRNAREVAWAMATRYQPERDTVILKGMEGYVIDPSADPKKGNSNIGFDATLRDKTTNPKVTFPKEAVVKAKEILKGARGT